MAQTTPIFAVLAAGLLAGEARAQSFDVPEGCAPFARVEYPSCVADVMYVCEGASDFDWALARVVRSFTNFALAYASDGTVVRQLAVGGHSDSADYVFSDRIDYTALRDTGEEEFVFSLDGEKTEGSLTMDDGYRFQSIGGLLRADAIGRTINAEGQVTSYDMNAYFLPDSPVMMASDYGVVVDVVRADDAGRLPINPVCQF